MAESDWRRVVAALRDMASRPTAAPFELGQILGIPIESDTPNPVAAALLRQHLREALHLHIRDAAPTDAQLEYLRDIAGQTGYALPLRLDDRELFDSWVQAIRAIRTASSL